mmetsp:Transcript_23321/g.72968  ORF Transcript_23321/g.72968 Transcript_23321/m.72968 type:complete len:191 (+) Transcript_23321:157-729(+)
MDVSKQVFSSGIAHLCGMGFAVLLAWGQEGGPDGSSECAWYFVLFTVDTTVGVLVTVSLHNYAVAWVENTTGVLGARWFDPMGDCGNYGDPPSWYAWGVQMAEWVVCTIMGRLTCALLVFTLRGGLVYIALGLDSVFGAHAERELFFVMVACPLGMNALQVWVQDGFLKWREGSSGGMYSRLVDVLPGWW